MKAVLRPFLGWHFPLVLLVTLFGVSMAYQFDTRHAIDVGEYYDRVYLSGFHEREPPAEVMLPPGGERYRWSEAQAEIVFPGVGARDRLLSLRLHGWRPEGLPGPEVQVFLNGRLLGRFVAGLTWQEYRFSVPAEAVGAGTLRVGLEVAAFVPAEVGLGSDPRSLGLAVSQVELLPTGNPGPAWPAWDQVGWCVLAVAACYLALAATGLRPRWAALAAGLAVGPLSFFLARYRLWTTIFTQRLAILAGLGLLLVLLCPWLFRRILRWGRVRATEREMHLLLVIFLLGFLLKAGGLLYPYSVAWDLKLQLHWSSWILDGRLGQVYGPASPLNELTMPQEWGEKGEKPLLPYSPFYHMTAALFFFLPWRPYDTANIVSVFLDTTRPFLLYFLALRLGLGRRAGLWAALLYAAFPATFLLHAWGNTPTTTGLWWCFAATCYMVGAWERLRHPRTWSGLVLFLLGALLFYTATAAMMGVFVLLLLLGLAPSARHLPGRPLGAVLLALVTAVGLALALYYGQFLVPLVTQTVPKVVEALRHGGVGLGTVPVSWPEYLRAHLDRLGRLRDGRVLLAPLALALIGLGGGGLSQQGPEERWRLRRWVLLACFGTALLFFLIGFRVDLVDKEIWFALPAIALCAGAALECFWRRGPAGRALGVGLLCFLVFAALYLWFFRLSTIRQEWGTSDARIVGAILPQTEMLLRRLFPLG